MELINSQDYQNMLTIFDEKKYVSELLENQKLDLQIFNNENFNLYLQIKINSQYRKVNITKS